MKKPQLKIIKPADLTGMASMYVDSESLEATPLATLREFSAPTKAKIDQQLAQLEDQTTPSDTAAPQAPDDDDDMVAMESARIAKDTADPQGDDAALIAWEVRQLEELIGGTDFADDPFADMEVVTNGGVSVLLTATERFLGRQNALKVLIPEHRGDPFLIRQFLREAQITSYLQHPNITPIYQAGYLPEVGPWYSMRLAEGETLQHIIGRIAADDSPYVARYDVYRMLEIFQRVCDAVAYAHSQGIVHLDIKPANIMVGRFGDVTLMDWGMAKELAKGDKRRSLPDVSDGARRHMVKGTPSYMAPEQARGDQAFVKEQTDIFLLGGTLYHMFLHQPPYPHPDPAKCMQLARSCTYLSPDNPRFQNLTVPPGVLDIVKKCLHAHPDQRYHKVSQIIREVDDLLRGTMSFQDAVFEKDQVIIEQDAVGDELYFIMSGEVIVYTTNKLGMTKELQRVGPGQIVGELALISDIPRQASVKATKLTRVRIMNKKNFKVNLQRMEPWVARLIESLAGRLLSANKHNRDLHIRPGFLKW